MYNSVCIRVLSFSRVEKCEDSFQATRPAKLLRRIIYGVRVLIKLIVTRWVPQQHSRSPLRPTAAVAATAAAAAAASATNSGPRSAS